MSQYDFDCPTCLQQDTEFQTHASRVFRQLLDLAPSDSSLSADMKMQDQGYHAQVAIHSVNGRFTAEASDADPIAVLDVLKGNTNEQISAWKLNREAI